MLDHLNISDYNVMPDRVFSWNSLNYYTEKSYFSLNPKQSVKILGSVDDKYYFVEVLNKRSPLVEYVIIALKIGSYITIIIPLICSCLARISRENRNQLIGKEFFYQNPHRTRSLFLENLQDRNLSTAKALYTFDNNVLLEKTAPDRPGPTYGPLEYVCHVKYWEGIKWLSSKTSSRDTIKQENLVSAASESGRVSENFEILYNWSPEFFWEKDSEGQYGFTYLCLDNRTDFIKRLLGGENPLPPGPSYELAIKQGFSCASLENNQRTIEFLYRLKPDLLVDADFIKRMFSSIINNQRQIEVFKFFLTIPGMWEQIQRVISSEDFLKDQRIVFDALTSVRFQENFDILYNWSPELFWKEDSDGLYGFTYVCFLEHTKHLIERVLRMEDRYISNHQEVIEQVFLIALYKNKTDLIDLFCRIKPEVLSNENFITLVFSMMKKQKISLGTFRVFCGSLNMKDKIQYFVNSSPLVQSQITAEVSSVLSSVGITCPDPQREIPSSSVRLSGSVSSLFEKILGPGVQATSQQQLKKTFKQKSLTLHPDKGGDEAFYAAFTEAWRHLQDTAEYKALPEE